MILKADSSPVELSDEASFDILIVASLRDSDPQKLEIIYLVVLSHQVLCYYLLCSVQWGETRKFEGFACHVKEW